MTMADTIAVMNGGVIEQLGAPEELYDSPATTFAANFLGQSNLVRGRVSGTTGDVLDVDAHGSTVHVPRERARVSEGEVWIGVRPEKVRLVGEGAGADAGSNVLRGGVLTDVSYFGVSTQFLIRMPWNQELTVFQQNTGSRGTLRPGDRVDMTWQGEHTFLLDARQDEHAGQVEE